MLISTALETRWSASSWEKPSEVADAIEKRKNLRIKYGIGLGLQEAPHKASLVAIFEKCKLKGTSSATGTSRTRKRWSLQRGTFATARKSLTSGTPTTFSTWDVKRADVSPHEPYCIELPTIAKPKFWQNR
jgi:hypothetical protein